MHYRPFGLQAVPVLRGFHVNLGMDAVHKIPMTTILVTIDHCFMYIYIYISLTILVFHLIFILNHAD